MQYQEAVEYLFNVAPLFQNIGQGAYKEGLTNTRLLDEHFGHPHQKFRTIHVAGTNGKGSCSHTLAAILQDAGYRVGLYTSPHLIDFRERIRVNGEMIPEERVVRFVEEERNFFEPLYPSFFELATALAFKYFEEQKVEVAVIEVGLGGRLDCTNIITPDLCVITNISFDHTQFLGHTLPEIAREKAGIIKPCIPVVIGETNGHGDVRQVFEDTAEKHKAPIVFADEMGEIISSENDEKGERNHETRSLGTLHAQLGGECQIANTATILQAVQMLQKSGYQITEKNIRKGFAHVCDLTGLMGRWQVVSTEPLTICDTGHNTGGLQYIGKQLESTPHKTLRMVIGMVGDKDVSGSLSLLPKEAVYYFTNASVKRAMPAHEIAELGKEIGLQGDAYDNVAEAYAVAKREADLNDIIYVGGSTFIVADFLAL